MPEWLPRVILRKFGIEQRGFNVPLPDPTSPDAPKYWKYETSGPLARSMERYLKVETLTEDDIALFRAYFVQWADSPFWIPNPNDSRDYFGEALAFLARLRRRGREITTVSDIHRCVHDADFNGMNPL